VSTTLKNSPSYSQLKTMGEYMVNHNAQNLTSNLETDILFFIDQYKESNEHLRNLMSNTINEKYEMYASLINSYDGLLLVHYKKISTFMQENYQRNDVVSDD